ncbi:MAG TPA: extracellular solute-binding protein [Candidatus Paceibacterota bacterium]
MKNFNTFQMVLIGVFAVFAVVGLLVFATYRGGSDATQNVGSVTIWGTIDERIMRDVIGRIRGAREGFGGVEYIEKDPRTYERDLVNALASGTGPDLFFLSEDGVLVHKDKVTVIRYDNYSERTFKDTFIEEGELYLTTDGILGLPFLVDPMVMYWNRNIFSGKGIASPPRYWDELFDFVPRVTERDQASNIVKSAVALGEFRNIRHAKAIFSTLLMQAGNPIVAQAERGLVSELSSSLGFATRPAEAALRFYTEFSNPVKSVYSWNRALPGSRESFLAGDLAIYFGFASEYQFLRDANPNLNFDMAPMPQSRDSSIQTTFGDMEALAISRTSDNIVGAFSAAIIFTDREAIADVSEGVGLPPVRRDLLSVKPVDAIGSVLYGAALMSRGWLDPNPEESTAMFQRMVESAISGRATLQDAVSTAHQELSNLLRGTN